MKVPYFKQETRYTCGAASMRMALAAFGIRKSEKQIAKLMRTNRKHGTSNASFPRVAEKYRVSYVIKRNGTIDDLKNYLKKGYVVIVSFFFFEYFEYKKMVYHFAVLKGLSKGSVSLFDPELGQDHKISTPLFVRRWKSNPVSEKGDRHWFFALKR